MNYTIYKIKRDKITTIRVNAELCDSCMGIYKNERDSRFIGDGYTGTFSDLIEKLLLAYKQNDIIENKE